MIVAAALAGYLIGSLPSAGLLGRLWGVDLRRGGSGNPGTNNALQLSGPGLAAVILLVEVAKGVAAVLAGVAIAGEPGAAVAGIAAATGNVFNMWYRFQGGKGLGISAGVLLALWPTVFVPAILLIVIAVLITRSSGAAALTTIAGVNVMAVAWHIFSWPVGWGLEDTSLLIVTSLGLGLVLWRKHWRDSPFSGRRRLKHRERV